MIPFEPPAAAHPPAADDPDHRIASDRTRTRPRALPCALALLCSWVLPLAANPVTDWNLLMLEAIRTDTTGPTLSTRNLAILHLAIYDAVNSIEAKYQPYLVTNSAPAGINPEVAAHSAGHRVAVRLYPSLRARAEKRFTDSLAAIPDDPARSEARAWGEHVADLHLQAREADGSHTEVTYVPRTEPGQWRRTPPFFRTPLTPHWGSVKPFAIPDPTEFGALPPPSLDSPRYAQDLNEVKTIGATNSLTRTREQTEIAIFWSDFSYTAMPPGHWHEIAATIAADRTLSLLETARMMALLAIAQADAAIVCWHDKFRYNLWRPVTAIQRADEDGNPLTERDPHWQPLLVTPPFPEYTSGHSVMSSAASTVLQRILGTDHVAFTARSDSLPGMIRSFTSLTACTDEVGLSRIYGGIHYRFAFEAGKESGPAISEYVLDNWLLPLASLPRFGSVRVFRGTGFVQSHGVVGELHCLETSSDLARWEVLARFTGAAGGTAIQLDSSKPTKTYLRITRR